MLLCFACRTGVRSRVVVKQVLLEFAPHVDSRVVLQAVIRLNNVASSNLRVSNADDGLTCVCCFNHDLRRSNVDNRDGPLHVRAGYKLENHILKTRRFTYFDLICWVPMVSILIVDTVHFRSSRDLFECKSPAAELVWSVGKLIVVCDRYWTWLPSEPSLDSLFTFLCSISRAIISASACCSVWHGQQHASL